jgi:DNA-nicking Smr family endonuclease
MILSATDHAEFMGPNHARLHSLAVDHARANYMSYESAYSHVYSRRENEQLRNAVKAEHMKATMAGYNQGEAAAPADPPQDYVNPGSAHNELERLVAKRMRITPNYHMHGLSQLNICTLITGY